MGYLASGEIFENMLQLKRFGFYFERIPYSKWLLSYSSNDISYRDARGFSLKKYHYLLLKNNDIATHLAIHSCYGLFCSQRNFKKHAL